MSGELTGATILLVDDDPLLRETLAQNLRDCDASVPIAGSGEEALRTLEAATAVDVVILDWKMPGMTGLETLQAMRANGFDVPTLFLTSLTDQIYEESALATGAVDFIDKSRSFTILLHRLEMILAGRKRRSATPDGGGDADPIDGTSRTDIGPLSIDLESGRAYWRGILVPLTLTEVQIVSRLASAPGRDVRYRELYDLVHGEGFQAGTGSDGYRANIRSFIKRIRQKFKAIDEGFDEIENYPGFGYRWRLPEGA